MTESDISSHIRSCKEFDNGVIRIDLHDPEKWLSVKKRLANDRGLSVIAGSAGGPYYFQ